MKRESLKVLVGLGLIMLITQSSYADKRSYVWTYEYMTMPKGMWELESYFTAEVPNMHRSNINTLKPWIELEYGITNNWDVSMYQMYKFKNKLAENDGQYDGFKLRTRYRFGQKNQFFIDPLIYLEYVRDPDFHKPNVIEAKLILAKDLGDFNISYNQILERNLEREGKTDHEYATGLSYAFSPQFKFGIEAKGNYSKAKCALGPTFAFSTRHFWVSLGAAFGLNQRTDDLQGRLIVGVPF